MEFAFAFAAALAFYSITLAPTVMWGDSGALARVVHAGPVEIGTAGDHPLFVIVGRLLSVLPFELATILNFEAAIFGALAVAMVYRCGRQLGASGAAAAVGAVTLAVSHAFWFHAVLAEVYTANAFFLVATISLLLDWRYRQRPAYLAAAAATFAIGLTNHLVLMAIAPAAVVFVAATNPRLFLQRRFLAVLGAAIAVLVASSILMPTVGTVLRRVWFGPPGIWDYFRLDVHPGPLARETGYYLAFLIYQFPSISLPLGFLGAWTLWRSDRAAAALLSLAIAVNAAVFIHHTAWPSAGSMKFVFYISDYAVFSILATVGADRLLRRLASSHDPRLARTAAIAILAIAAVLPPTAYAIVPAAAARLDVDLIGARRLPYRNNQTYFLNPNKRGEDSAKRFASEALQMVAPNAALFADSTPYEPLRYLQYTEGIRPDVVIRSPYSYGDQVRVSWMFVNGHRRPTYLAALTPDYDLRGLTGQYELKPTGPIIEVRPTDGQ